MTPAKLLDNPRISIHAPREGCDYKDVISTHIAEHFNPRTP